MKLIALLVFGAAYLVAQIGGGSIIGYVTDPSGAAVPGVTVTATNVKTNASQQTATNDSGYYEFPLLAAGSYHLEAEKEGFQKARSAGFDLSSGTRPRIDLKLALGRVTEAVEVVSQAPLVNATTTDLGNVIENRKISELPLNGRNFLQLVGLQAGVVNAPSSSTGGRGGIEFHGSPALGNNLLLDGVDMSFGENNATAGDTAAGAGTAGSLIQTISVEAIEEFKATGSAFSAEYGRATGGVLNVTTKSGTNNFHGSLFEFFRNDKLDANSFFSNNAGLAKPPLRWNQFGGNLGGPIQRNKLFFFFNYEGAIVRRNEQVTGNVPTPALLSQLTPAIREAYSWLPADYTPTSNPLVGFHRRNDPRTNDEHTTVSRIDWLLGGHRLAVRYNYNHQDFSEPTLRPRNRQIYPTRFHNTVIQDSVAFSPNVFNEFRIGYNRNDLDRHFTDTETIPAWVGNIPAIGINASLINHIHYITNTYSLVDNLTLVRGRHTLKMGLEIREVRSGRVQGGPPIHNYLSVNDLIADRSNSIQMFFGGGKDLDSTNYGFYLQDDWRIGPRIQLNAGLRYEYYTPLKGGFNVQSSDPFGSFNTSKDQALFVPDRNNFAPRLGLVVDTLGNQKLILRAGGGISYAPVQPFFYYALSFLDPRIPFNATLTPADLPPGYFTAFPFPRDFIDAIAQNPSLLPSNFILSRNIADYNRRDEYAGQWNLSLQYAVKPTLAVQASYVGSRALNMYSTRNLNLFDPALGRRPHPEFGDVDFRENAGRSTYHALQISANQKLSGGLAFDMYYTLSKTLTYYAVDGTQTTDSNVQDPNNIAGSYGPKIGEARHRFVGVGSYAIPTGATISGSRAGRALLSGWTLQGIVTTRSGSPINVLSGVDFVGNRRVAGQRPDLVSGVDPYLRSEEVLTWLNREAFDNATPRAERRFGNLGFNALRGPGSVTFDGAVHRVFPIREGHRLAFRLELFNALNHANLGNPNNTVSNPNFGRILNASGSRNIQLALKYNF